MKPSSLLTDILVTKEITFMTSNIDWTCKFVLNDRHGRYVLEKRHILHSEYLIFDIIEMNSMTDIYSMKDMCFMIKMYSLKDIYTLLDLYSTLIVNFWEFLAMEVHLFNKISCKM